MKTNKKPPKKIPTRGCLASGKLLSAYLDDPRTEIIIIRWPETKVTGDLEECRRLENLRD